MFWLLVHLVVNFTSKYSLRFYLFATFWFTQEFRRCHFHSFLMYFLTPLALNRMGKGKKVLSLLLFICYIFQKVLLFFICNISLLGYLAYQKIIVLYLFLLFFHQKVLLFLLFLTYLMLKRSKSTLKKNENDIS